MTDFTLVYMTAPSASEAGHIARTLVDEQLAACVNILPQMISVYRWNNALEEASELVLIAKTRASLFDALAARVKTLHSYSNPCIVALPITQGAPAFLDWLSTATRTP
jgi:periplasmic divalent cation tolerance protein